MEIFTIIIPTIKDTIGIFTGTAVEDIHDILDQIVPITDDDKRYVHFCNTMFDIKRSDWDRFDDNDKKRYCLIRKCKSKYLILD